MSGFRRACYFLLSSCFITFGVSGAQTFIPAGCFVTDEVRSLYITPPTCYNEDRFSVVPYSPDNGFTTEQLYTFYGFQMGFLVYNSWDTYYKWQAAETNSTTHYSWYLSEFDKNKRLKALEKKLRKTCGSKCKKIVTVASLSTTDSLNKPMVSSSSEGLSFGKNLSQFGPK